jgi:hypothetical protein
MSGIDDPKNATLGLPSAADMDGADAKLDAVTAALRNAAARQAGLLDAARVVLALAGVAMKGAGIPLGSTAADLARAALDAATEPRA